MTYSFKQQIAALDREIALRKSVYKKKVNRFEMTKEEAAFEIGVMEAIKMSLKDKEYTGSVPPQQVVQTKLF